MTAAGGGARPERTTLILVGIECYAAGEPWELRGPAADARRFAEWFWSRGVRPERTSVFVSAPPTDSSWTQAPVLVREASRDLIRSALVREVAQADGDLLVVVWGGHGMVDETGRRHLFTADATATDPLNIDVDSVLTLHRSSAVPSFANQLWIVDACQTLHDGARSRRGLPGESFGVRDTVPGRIQEVLFAASPGERAANVSPERTGLFSRELLADLDATPDWPPDVSALADRQRRRFAALREQGLARQTPTYLWFRDRSGREGQLLAGRPPGGPPTTSRTTTTAARDLTPLVDALEAVPEFRGVGFRDEVVSLLRGEVGGAVRRFPGARLEAVSLVRTCLRFPGGLSELADVVLLCAGGVPESLAFAAAVNAVDAM